MEDAARRVCSPRRVGNNRVGLLLPQEGVCKVAVGQVLQERRNVLEAGMNHAISLKADHQRNILSGATSVVSLNSLGAVSKGRSTNSPVTGPPGVIHRLVE